MKRNSFVKVLACIALAGLTLFLNSCATDSVTGDTVYNLYTIDEEVNLGQEAMAENIKEFKKEGGSIVKKGEKVEELNDILASLAAVSDLPALPYEVTLFKTNIVNAAAMPGGQIMVFSGLYNSKNGLVKSKDEMAAVLAHEIAHVNCRHSTEELSKYITAAMITEIAAEIAEESDKEDLADLLRGAFLVGELFIVPKYSRAQEKEADHVGLTYMARAGYDPRAAAAIWKRAAEMEEKAKEEGNSIEFLDRMFSIFDTHPDSALRYEYLLAEIPAAMEEYKEAVGHYPKGYDPTQPVEIETETDKP